MHSTTIRFSLVNAYHPPTSPLTKVLSTCSPHYTLFGSSKAKTTYLLDLVVQHINMGQMWRSLAWVNGTLSIIVDCKIILFYPQFLQEFLHSQHVLAYLNIGDILSLYHGKNNTILQLGFSWHSSPCRQDNKTRVRLPHINISRRIYFCVTNQHNGFLSKTLIDLRTPYQIFKYPLHSCTMLIE